jgi:hypothetical protein
LAQDVNRFANRTTQRNNGVDSNTIYSKTINKNKPVQTSSNVTYNTLNTAISNSALNRYDNYSDVEKKIALEVKNGRITEQEADELQRKLNNGYAWSHATF